MLNKTLLLGSVLLLSGCETATQYADATGDYLYANGGCLGAGTAHRCGRRDGHWCDPGWFHDGR